MQAGDQYQGRLDGRAEGDGVQKDRHENAQDLRDRARKKRRSRPVRPFWETEDESLEDAVQPGVYSPESPSPLTAFTNDAADVSRAAGQVPTPSKSPGKRLASPLRQLGGQEQKKVRLSLTASEVNWGNKSVASGTTAPRQEASHGDLPHQEVWSLQGIPSTHPGGAKSIGVRKDKDEDKKDDSDHSTSLDHSDPSRFSDSKLPGKRVAAQSNVGGKRKPPKRARLSSCPAGQVDLGYGRPKCDHVGSTVHDRAEDPPTGPPSSATRAVPPNVGTSTQLMSSGANQRDPKLPQRRSYMSTAWAVIRGLCGWKSHDTPRP